MQHVPPPEVSWARISAWLHAQAPASAATLTGQRSPATSPATSAALTAAAAETGITWPPQLLVWFQLHDWNRDESVAGFLPGWHAPLSLTQSLETWRMWQDIVHDLAAQDPFVAESLDEAPLKAGEVAGVYLPSFIPIDEDQSGEVLVVDCRPGPRQGCVTQWMKHDADYYGTGWWSIAEMLADVADHLQDQTPCRFWRPEVVDGYLIWELDAALGSESHCLARKPEL